LFAISRRFRIDTVGFVSKRFQVRSPPASHSGRSPNPWAPAEARLAGPQPHENHGLWTMFASTRFSLFLLLRPGLMPLWLEASATRWMSCLIRHRERPCAPMFGRAGPSELTLCRERFIPSQSAVVSVQCLTHVRRSLHNPSFGGRRVLTKASRLRSTGNPR
jgi:hypothetical protein